MKHDELLAKLKAQIPLIDTNNPILWSAYKAVIKIACMEVELHKPYINYRGDECFCIHCGEDTEYPCSYIQAIEKELNK